MWGGNWVHLRKACSVCYLYAKNFRNRSKFDKVLTKNKFAQFFFFETQCRWSLCTWSMTCMRYRRGHCDLPGVFWVITTTKRTVKSAMAHPLYSHFWTCPPPLTTAWCPKSFVRFTFRSYCDDKHKKCRPQTNTAENNSTLAMPCWVGGKQQPGPREI